VRGRPREVQTWRHCKLRRRRLARHACERGYGEGCDIGRLSPPAVGILQDPPKATLNRRRDYTAIIWGLLIAFGATVLGVATVAALVKLEREDEIPSSAVELIAR